MELQELLEIIYGVIGSTVIPAFTVFLGYQINKFIQSKVSVDEQSLVTDSNQTLYVSNFKHDGIISAAGGLNRI